MYGRYSVIYERARGFSLVAGCPPQRGELSSTAILETEEENLDIIWSILIEPRPLLVLG